MMWSASGLFAVMIFERLPIRHGCCEVDQFAVNLAGKRSLRKARADGSRHIGDGRAAGALYRAIG